MEYNRYIDHTLLKPDASDLAIDQLCDEALRYHFASVCVNPCYVSQCYRKLKNTDVKICTVIGFPLGANATIVKVNETREAIFDGANEIDMVINISRLKEKDDAYIVREIEKIKKAMHTDMILKVIIETCLLTDEEKVRACVLAKQAGADYVKTSTGFSTGGATTQDIALMRKTVGPNLGVKASGGVRTKDAFLAMIEAGATRVGSSSSISIMEALQKQV